MSTVKITRSQIRDLILEYVPIENRGDTIKSIVDEFVMTAVDDITNLGMYGEEIVEKLLGGKNLNSPNVKRRNFPFADVIVGDMNDLENADLISVKSTSSLGSGKNTNVSVVFKNSSVNLRKLQRMLNGTGVNGFRDEIMNEENPVKKLKISVVSVQPVVPWSRKFKNEFSKEEKENKPLHILVVKYTKEFNVLINKENNRQPVSLQGLPFGKVLKSHFQVEAVFGPPRVIGAFPTRARATPAYIRAHRIDAPTVAGVGSAADRRQYLLQRFRYQLRYLDNTQLNDTIEFMTNLSNVDRDIQESIIKECRSIMESKRLKNGCIPARRKISSGGKAGTYADPRTGGKQAYAALKKAKPPGSKGGWTKKKNICCHKCPNDRSAPNGYVCTNPSHLYWGTKGDNTTDQWHGNGSAQNEEKLRSDIKAMIWELIPEEVLKNSE